MRKKKPTPKYNKLEPNVPQKLEPKDPLNEPNRETSRYLRDFFQLPKLHTLDLQSLTETLHAAAVLAQDNGRPNTAIMLGRFCTLSLWEARSRGLFVDPTIEEVQDVLDGITKTSK